MLQGGMVSSVLLGIQKYIHPTNLGEIQMNIKRELSFIQNFINGIYLKDMKI
jgi:hypothetical protein